MPLAPDTVVVPIIIPPYTTRVLPVEEWPKLAVLPPFVALGGLPDPACATVVVVEDAVGHLVASWVAVPFTHLEGVWTAEECQHTRVPALLLRAMIAHLKADGVPVAFTLAPDPNIQALAEHAGFEVIPATLMGLKL